MTLALAQANISIRDGVWPYPGVGVVLVRDDMAVAVARNDKPGVGAHAEIKAIEEAKKRGVPTSECVLYTNLEPCANIGLLLPCSVATVESGIREVHIAMRDPYYLVRGKGIKQLQDAGVNVIMGEYEEEARWQNRKYLERFCPHCGWPIVDS